MEPIYFVHPDPQTCAWWLSDKTIQKYAKELEPLLSSAILCMILEPHYALDLQNHPNLLWVTLSRDHVLWVKNFYQHVISRYNDIYYGGLRTWKFDTILMQYIKAFPTNGWIEPRVTFPADCVSSDMYESYRLLYKRTRVRSGDYRRQKKPYWLLTE